MHSLRIAVVLVLVMAAAPFACAHVDLQVSFPSQFGSWTANTSPEKIKYLPSEADLLAEAGLRDVLVRTFGRGDETVAVTIHQFGDPSGAYEMYTAWIGPEMNPSTVGPLTAIGNGQLLMLVGNYLVRVMDARKPSAEDLQELAKAVRKMADTAPLPPIRQYLPEGFADGTQRYALGTKGFVAALDAVHRSEYAVLAPEIGFANGAEAMLAEYRKGNENAVLLVVEYPTPSLAEQQLRHLLTVLPTGTQVEVKIERRASLLSAVLGATSAAYAERLRKDVNYETEVTWHQPTHTITDPPWVVVLSRIFMGTGVFLVAALVLGIAFGGIRVLTKRLFPGKVFDRPQDIEVLQLGLSGKPIDPSDFYRR